MEKEISRTTGGVVKHIVVIGPESTGKTTLARQLAEYYSTLWLPEYAREYVENLNRAYNFEDVVLIAKNQIVLKKQIQKQLGVRKYIFYDTDLIITKVWFDVVYNRVPDWLDIEIRNQNIDLYLLCDTDIEWQPDAVRENGGESRIQLFNIYKNEIEKLNIPYVTVSGKNQERVLNAINFIETCFEI